MVYKLRKATRFMFVKVFVGIIIFSLIIGAISSVIVGLAITFDNESFSPSLIDDKDFLLEGCEVYRSEECKWFLIDDINKTESLTDNDKRFIRNQILSNKLDGSFITLTPQDDDGNDTLLFVQLIIIDPINFWNDPSSNILCQEFSFEGVPSDKSCKISPFISVFSNTSYLIVADRLVTNTTTGEKSICDDFTNRFTCKFNFDNTTRNYKAKIIDNTIVTDAFCSSIEGNQTTIGKEKFCIVDAERQYVSPKKLDNLLLLDTNLPFFDEGEVVYCVREKGDCNDFDVTNEYFVIDNDNFIRQAQIVSYNVFNEEGSILNLKSLTSTQEDFLQPLCTFEDKYGYNCFPFSSEIEESLKIYKGDIFSINKDLSKLKLLVGKEGEDLRFTFGKYYFGEAKSVFEVLPLILDTRIIIGAISIAMPTIAILIAINVSIALLVSILGLWRRLGKRLTTRFALAFKGKIGSLLEMTQFFQFSGDWYLEAIAVHDYNFTGWRPAFKELVTERWRDTIFFPVSLAATLSVLLVTITNKPNLFWSILIFAPILPILLTFWTPFIWIMQDSGLKRVNWGETGDVNAIERISNIVRDGFNKLVGIGAVLGLGTAGSTAIRESITGVSSDSQFLTKSIESLLSFNLNFLVSAGIWTVGLFFLICAASLPGVVFVSLVYLNKGQIENVKILRERMKKADIMFGTSTQMMQDHDVSVYYDSSKKEHDADLSNDTGERRGIESFFDVPDVYDKEEDVSDDREKKLDQAEKDGSLEIVDDSSSKKEDNNSSSENEDNNSSSENEDINSSSENDDDY